MYVCLWVCLSVLLSLSPPSSFEAGFLTEPRTRLEATKPWHSPHLCPLWLWDYRCACTDTWVLTCMLGFKPGTPCVYSMHTHPLSHLFSSPHFTLLSMIWDRKKLDSHSIGFWISVVFSLFCMGLTPLLSKEAILIV